MITLSIKMKKELEEMEQKNNAVLIKERQERICRNCNCIVKVRKTDWCGEKFRPKTIKGDSCGKKSYSR